MRETTLTVPLFVLAVLGAVTLAMRWFGASGHRPRQVMLTGLLVAAAGTLAGIALLPGSARERFATPGVRFKALTPPRAAFEVALVASPNADTSTAALMRLASRPPQPRPELAIAA